jgi:hypothetical protein
MSKKTPQKPHVRVRYVLFCDDIRSEANGKSIFIGVYHGMVLFQAFPAVQPISIWMHLDQDAGGPIPIKCRVVVYPGAREAGRVEIRLESPEGNQHASLALGGIPVLVTEAGHIALEMAQYDEEFKEIARLETKKVDFITSATGVSQPSVQSQTVLVPKV